MGMKHIFKRLHFFNESRIASRVVATLTQTLNVSRSLKRFNAHYVVSKQNCIHALHIFIATSSNVDKEISFTKNKKNEN